MKRHLLGCMIVMLALLLVMLAGCGHTDKENTTTSATLTEEGTTLPSDSVTSESNTGNQGDEPAVLTLTLMENGATNFKVIRAESASNEISLSAITLRTTLNDLTGGKFGIASDWSKTIDQDAQEIVVGHTNRTDEIAFRAELKEKGPYAFGIKVTEKKVIITATEDDFVPLAVDYFLKYCVKTNPETGLILETGKFVMTDQCNVVICGEKSDLSSITSDHNYATLSEKVGKITKSGNFNIMQGGYINENYAWIAMINTADYDTKAAGVYIYKYDVKTWRMVKRSQVLMLDHANDITYDPATNELYVVHCYVDSKKVTVIDADSLEVKRTMHVTGGYGIYSLTYNPERKQFVGGTGKTNMVFFNDKLAFTGYRPGVSTQLITQGITSDSRYVYHVLFTTQSVEPYNMIFVYDIEKGKLQNKIRLSISGQEPENISIVNGEFMIGCNSSSASYADVFHSILIDFGVW